MAIIDVIKCEGPNNVLVWKHPKEDFNTSAQLIVHESQEAILYKDGQASEPYLAGKHTIQTENIPGIRKIVGLVTGGVSPNHYEVFYINKACSMDVYWGTATPWMMHDPSLQIPFKMRAFGQFAIRVEDSRMLMQKLVGTMTSFTQKTLTESFRGILMSHIAELISNLMVDENLSATQISMKLTFVGQKVSEKFSEILKKYGLILEEFAVENISIEEDKVFQGVREAMGRRAERIIEGYDKQQEMAHDVAMAQAQNPGMGGQAAQVMTGIAAGAAMAPAVGNMVRNTMQPASNGFGQPAQQRDQFSMGVVRKKAETVDTAELKCAGCGAALSPNSRFCNQCGIAVETASVENNTVSCPVCGEKNAHGSRFCNSCGSKL